MTRHTTVLGFRSNAPLRTGSVYKSGWLGSSTVHSLSGACLPAPSQLNRYPHDGEQSSAYRDHPGYAVENLPRCEVTSVSKRESDLKLKRRKDWARFIVHLVFQVDPVSRCVLVPWISNFEEIIVRNAVTGRIVEMYRCRRLDD